MRSHVNWRIGLTLWNKSCTRGCDCVTTSIALWFVIMQHSCHIWVWSLFQSECTVRRLSSVWRCLQPAREFSEYWAWKSVWLLRWFFCPHRPCTLQGLCAQPCFQRQRAFRKYHMLLTFLFTRSINFQTLNFTRMKAYFKYFFTFGFILSAAEKPAYMI